MIKPFWIDCCAMQDRPDARHLVGIDSAGSATLNATFSRGWSANADEASDVNTTPTTVNNLNNLVISRSASTTAKNQSI
jgi:hypothetical protein